MRLAYLFAHPAGHSLSPAMQNAAFAAAGVDAVYRALDVPPAELAARIGELRRDDALGANVTVPHKEAALRLVDRATAAAAAVGAVNTIVRRGEELVGDNTDAGGFARALDESGIDPGGASALVLGAGGAARAVVYALALAGAGRIGVYNRTAGRAARLARDLSDVATVRVVTEDELGMAGRSTTLLVNATSVGMAGSGTERTLPCPRTALPERGAVVDIVYRPAQTPLLAEAAMRGLITQNGVAMLVHQGAAAFEQWTGAAAPVLVMRGVLDAALAAE